MKSDLKDLIKSEIIGLEVEVIDSKNKDNIGIKGKIIDDTKNTIVIQDKKGSGKILLKNNITIKIKTKKQAAVVKGKLLFGKSKNRIKN
ncbi:ribonuclease P protein subunit [Candidatus Woesearchaeota archaeon]|nr:ribonuclease P protein subunit [Candidatus Woesearchaeota archaeon]